MTFVTHLDILTRIPIMKVEVKIMVPEVEELEELRKELGYSQEGVARSMDIALSTYQKWVTEDVRPSYNSLQKINKFMEEKGSKKSAL